MFQCKIYYEDPNIVIMECVKKTLKELSQELGMSYQQVADISSKKRKRCDYQKFKYYPKIEIKKIIKP